MLLHHRYNYNGIKYEKTILDILYNDELLLKIKQQQKQRASFLGPHFPVKFNVTLMINPMLNE